MINIIIQLLLTPVFALAVFILSFLPSGYNLPAWSFHFIDICAKGLMFFPFPCFLIIIGNITFWLAAHMVWACIEWAYKKIPGVS